MATTSNTSAGPELPTTQKAWRLIQRGPPPIALEFAQNAPVRTELAEGEVLVKVGAAALNPVGYGMMELLPNFMAKRPYDAAEHDLAGTVVRSRSPLHAVGTKVLGFIDAGTQPKSKQGSLCQYTIVPGDRLVTRPEGMSAVDAAGITLTAQTAHQALFKEAGLEEGMSVLVNGGSSSVGLFAIQIAKARGLKVWATASGKNEELVRSVGADHFVDYTKGPLHLTLSSNPPSPKFNAIFDAVGIFDPSLFNASEAYLAPGGTYVSTGSTPKLTLGGLLGVGRFMWSTKLCPTFLGGTDRKFRIFLLESDHDRLVEIQDFIAAGKVRPIVDSVFAFEDVLKAYERIKTHRAKGKVVVTIDPEA